MARIKPTDHSGIGTGWGVLRWSGEKTGCRVTSLLLSIEQSSCRERIAAADSKIILRNLRLSSITDSKDAYERWFDWDAWSVGRDIWRVFAASSLVEEKWIMQDPMFNEPEGSMKLWKEIISFRRISSGVTCEHRAMGGRSLWEWGNCSREDRYWRTYPDVLMRKSSQEFRSRIDHIDDRTENMGEREGSIPKEMEYVFGSLTTSIAQYLDSLSHIVSWIETRPWESITRWREGAMSWWKGFPMIADCASIPWAMEFSISSFAWYRSHESGFCSLWAF